MTNKIVYFTFFIYSRMMLSEDSENINPDDLLHSVSSQGLPLDCVDGRVLSQSPIIRCSVDRPAYNPNSPTTPSKRFPLSLNQSIFNTPVSQPVN